MGKINKNKEQKFKVVGYLRVSTDTQHLDNQKLGILELANKNNWNISLVEETVSGKVSYKVREIGRVVDTLEKDDVLIVSEFSRLGRSMLEIMQLLSELSQKGVCVYSIKGNYQLDGTIQSKIMTMVFCMAAEIERDLISQRTKEALAKKKKEGVKLGRPKGSLGKSKLDCNKDAIKELYLDKKVSIASLSKIYDCSFPTMANFVRKKILLTLT